MSVSLNQEPTINTPPKLYLQLTKGEWDLIEVKVKKLGKSDIHSFLRCELSRFTTMYKACPPCISPADGPLIKIRHHIPEEQLEALLWISEITGRPISTIVMQLFIMPLLQPGTDAAL
jgi:hypothetical protein